MLGLTQPEELFEEDGAITGPTIAGCRYSSTIDTGDTQQQLTLKFNSSLLGGEGLMLRPFDANETGGWGGPHEEDNSLYSALRMTTDSSGVMVCTVDPQCERPPCGNETTCQCQGWNYIRIGYCNATGCPMTSHWYCEVCMNFCFGVVKEKFINKGQSKLLLQLLLQFCQSYLMCAISFLFIL